MKTTHVSAAVVLAAVLLLAAQTRGEGARDAPGDFARLEEARAATVKEFFLKGKDAYPELARYLSELTLDSRCHAGVILFLCCEGDGLNMLSQGDPVLLSMTRDLLTRQLEQKKACRDASTEFVLTYLAQKGDEDDLAFIQEHLLELNIGTNASPNIESPNNRRYRILQMRVAGTNVISGMLNRRWYPEYNIISGWHYTTNWLSFLPSVANTGPQAEYVYKAYWQAIGLKGGLSSRDTPYSIITNVAPELLTMRVWFNADGKAVTDTDLSKYGISVPGLSLASPDSITNAPPAEPPQEPIPAPPSKMKSTAVSLMIGGVSVLAGLLIAVRLWKRR